MSRAKIISLSIIFLLFLCLYNSFFVIKDGQRGISLSLGKIMQAPQIHRPKLLMPGLHFQWPFIMQYRILDLRVQTTNVQSQAMTTLDTRNIDVTYYVTWHISEPYKYLLSTGGNASNAQALFKQAIENSLRDFVGQHTLAQLLAADLSDAIRLQIGQSTKVLGLWVFDVRLKNINFSSGVSKSVYQRMQANCERIAATIRAAGKAKAETLRANADAEANVSLANAKADAARIRGEGDAEAAAIYADAYGRDTNFYTFYRSLLAYKHIFSNKRDYLVLKPDSQFFKYFNNGYEVVGNKK